MINQERLVKTFMDYVQIDSPTKDELTFARFITGELEKLGFSVSMDNAGEAVGSNAGNVIARHPGSLQGETLLFSCHMDTVSPSRGIKPIIKGEAIYSDGQTILGADNKAGIAAIIEAFTSLRAEDKDHGPIEIVFSIYEEGGLFGAKGLAADQLEATKAFVLDSGGDPGQIIIKGPAQDKVNAHIKGRPAHAGVAPEEGISALMVAARAISKMKLLRIDEETTANIGSIEGGGATNIVTPEATVRAEARSLSNEKLADQSRHMKACFEEAAAYYGASVDVEVERMYSAFSIEETAPIVQHVKKACEAIGISPFTGATGGGSDTNIFNEKGIPAVNLGIGERKPHTLEEHIYIKDLVATAELVKSLVLTR